MLLDVFFLLLRIVETVVLFLLWRRVQKLQRELEAERRTRKSVAQKVWKAIDTQKDSLTTECEARMANETWIKNYVDDKLKPKANEPKKTQTKPQSRRWSQVRDEAERSALQPATMEPKA